MKKTLLAIACCLSLSPAFAAPSFDEISDRGDRNLKIIFSIYEKYPFMPAKKAYFTDLETRWIRDKNAYLNSAPEKKKDLLENVLKTYRTTNDVLKDICIDMANLSDNILGDFTEKLTELESRKKNLTRQKLYNRFTVSRRQFARAEHGFKKSLYYYSAGLYDHGIDLMISIYRENGWNLPGIPATTTLTENTAQSSP